MSNFLFLGDFSWLLHHDGANVHSFVSENAAALSSFHIKSTLVTIDLKSGGFYIITSPSFLLVGLFSQEFVMVARTQEDVGKGNFHFVVGRLALSSLQQSVVGTLPKECASK